MVEFALSPKTRPTTHFRARNFTGRWLHASGSGEPEATVPRCPPDAMRLHRRSRTWLGLPGRMVTRGSRTRTRRLRSRLPDARRAHHPCAKAYGSPVPSRWDEASRAAMRTRRAYSMPVSPARFKTVFRCFSKGCRVRILVNRSAGLVSPGM